MASARIPQVVPWLEEAERAAVSETVAANWITEGPKAAAFSARLIGVEYGVFAPNGTLALALGLMALGVGAGDEVLVPSLSPATPTRERRRVARAIVELEGLQDLTLYCNREARQAHYSMEFADLHPEALIQGLLGTLERGRFKPYRP